MTQPWQLSPLFGIPPRRCRYLILTYRVEYDRVHYPLPLSFEEVPSVSSLQRVIRRLRKVGCVRPAVSCLPLGE